MSEISLKLKLLKQYIKLNCPDRCPACIVASGLLCRDCPVYIRGLTGCRVCLFTLADGDEARITLAKDVLKLELMELIVNE